MTLDGDPLSSKVGLLEALCHGPSREKVSGWLNRWPSLDDEFGAGHTVGLELAMFHATASEDRKGFRAAWVLALLSQAKKMQRVRVESLFLDALDKAREAGTQRELIRGLLGLDLSLAAQRRLFVWATHAPFSEDVSTAHAHQALLIMLRWLDGHVVSSSDRMDMDEVCSHLLRGPFSGPVKKKAALLRARLSMD